jgi:hypothetical protein
MLCQLAEPQAKPRTPRNPYVGKPDPNTRTFMWAIRRRMRHRHVPMTSFARSKPSASADRRRQDDNQLALGPEVDAHHDLDRDDRSDDPVDGGAEWWPPPGAGDVLSALLPSVLDPVGREPERKEPRRMPIHPVARRRPRRRQLCGGAVKMGRYARYADRSLPRDPDRFLRRRAASAGEPQTARRRRRHAERSRDRQLQPHRWRRQHLHPNLRWFRRGARPRRIFVPRPKHPGAGRVTLFAPCDATRAPSVVRQ